MKNFSLAVMALCLSSAYGFAPQPATKATSSLNLFENERQAAAGVVASVLLAGNVMMAAPAIAATTFDDFGSSEIVAARSGGRSGGRASMGGRSMGRSYSAPRTTYRSSTTIVRPMVSPSPVIVAPMGGFGYGYNPLGGFGMGYGLGAMNSAGNAMRDYRQESEIQQSKAELEVAKQKELELEQRIKALEASGAIAPAAPVPSQ